MGDNPHDSMSERIGALTGAFFMFGLAALFMTHAFWPGILVLLAMTPIPILIHEKGIFAFWIIAQMVIWLLGIPLLLMTHTIWPGILILAGLSALLVGIFPPDKLDAKAEERKRRRQAGVDKIKHKRVSLDDLIAAAQDDDGELMIEDEDEPRAQRRSR
jgi:hypothetical protein